MSSMIESLAQTRHAERYRDSRRALAAAAPIVGEDATDACRDGSALESTRARTGWLLIGLGLRLALPGDRATSRRITLKGR